MYRDDSTASPMLDQPSLLAELDRGAMLRLVQEFPEQCRQARRLVAHTAPAPGDYRQIVVLGMGGSAVGGDLLRVLLDAEGAPAPVIVARDYRCPGFVGSNTLCIAASYSGNTEETLSATRDALQRGASVVAISTGGEVTEIAHERALPFIHVPGGQPPRSALGYMFVPVLRALSALGLCRDFEADLDEAIQLMERLVKEWGPDTPTDRNQAKRMALALRRSLPVIYGSGAVTGLVAFRWKCQFNENAKMHAIWNSLPELDHNEICGWRSARRQGKLRWVFLRDRSDPPRMAQRLEITRSVIAATSAGHTDVWGQGQSLLARTLSSILLGDFVTVYAALLNGADPSDIREIDVLKEELSAVR